MKLACDLQFACSKCGSLFTFSEKWIKKNKDKEFTCRGCKIKASWTDEKRLDAKAKSEAKLSTSDIKSKMSMMASISNSKNAGKISSSLKKYFRENKKKAVTPKAESIVKIKNAIKEKWQDDVYRAKILMKRWEKQDSTIFKVKLTSKEKKIKSQLTKDGTKFTMDYFLGPYEFKFFVKEKILIDTESDNNKKLFIEHYFPQYEYRTDWK